VPTLAPTQAAPTVQASAIRIGRAPDNDIVLRHVQVSRHHATVQRRGEGWEIVDPGSTNGTFVNGDRVSGACTLRDGDNVRISEFVFRFGGGVLERTADEGTARVDAISLHRWASNGKVLLDDVSLSIQPRELVAIVGGSGSGKSTLMKALCGIIPADEGSVLVNGTDFYRHFDAFRSSLGYVPQDDIIHRELTVYRALYYTARLRLPKDATREEIEERIQEVLEDVHMEHRRDVPIAALSGGQRKRVSIAVELLSRPRLFFLDEPSSGLDPGTEADLMQLLRRLADKGHTVILITHATQNIELCDRVAFLAAGGRLAFYGPPEDARAWFGVPGFAQIYQKLEREKSPDQWAAEFKASPEYLENVARHQTSAVSPPKPVEAGVEIPRSIQRARVPGPSFLRQLSLLTRRYVEIILRDRIYLGLATGAALLIGLLLVMLFPSDTLLPFDPAPEVLLDPASSSSLQDRLGMAQVLLFFIMFAPLVFGLMNALREISKELPIFRRERMVGLGVVPYVLSKFLVLGVIALVQVALVEAMVLHHFQIPQGGSGLRGMLFATLGATALAATALGLALSALLNETQVSPAFVAILCAQLFLSGRFPKVENSKGWLSYLTISRWTFTLLANLTGLWRIFPNPSDIDELDASMEGMPSDDDSTRQMDILKSLVPKGESMQATLAADFQQLLGFLALNTVVFLILACLILARRTRHAQ
jgi:ABC-type multidrug transport system ATPase subunit